MCNRITEKITCGQEKLRKQTDFKHHDYDNCYYYFYSKFTNMPCAMKWAWGPVLL